MSKYLEYEGLDYLLQALDQRYAKDADLDGVAKSGSYNDLTDKPTIPNQASDIGAMPADTTLADLGGVPLTAVGETVAPLNQSGLIDSQYLPSFVDDVIETYVVDGYDALGANWLSTTINGNPLLPERGKIYVVLSPGQYENKQYRWSGTSYVAVGGDIDLSAYATQSWVNNQGFLTQHQDISGKADIADLANVATTGDYDDLINKPTIPTVPTNVSSFTNDAGYLTQHQSLSGYATETWVGQQGYLTQHQDISGKANSADLASVALSGSYTDLSNKPTIPTKVSDLTNDSGFLTQHQSLNGYATETWVGQQGYLTSHQDISGKANSADLATVATSGDYGDLINKPTITNTRVIRIDGSNFSNVQISNEDKEYLVNLYNYGYQQYPCEVVWTRSNLNYQDYRFIYFGKKESSYELRFLGRVLDYGLYELLIKISPSNNTVQGFTSPESNLVITDSGIRIGSTFSLTGTTTTLSEQLYEIKTNYATQTWIGNQGYLTSHQDISGKANSADLATVATTGDYEDLINLPTLPTKVSDLTNDAGYLTQHQSLSGYATETWVGQQGFLTSHQDISGKANSADLATVATSGSYTDLSNKPTIPTKVSDLINDSGFLTVHQSLSGYATETWVGQQGFLTSHQDISGKANTADLATVATSGDYDDLINKPTIPTIPTAISSFTNDAGYITSSYHDATKQDVLADNTGSAVSDKINVGYIPIDGTTITVSNGVLTASGGSSSSIPDCPTTTNGTYMLICSVSSGTPTYSWQQITVGGSY